MKISLERDVMADAVAWAARSLPSRPSVPVLAGLLIEADAEGISFSSFDYETSAHISVPGQVTEEGKILVSGKLLADIARSLPNRPVNLESDSTKAQLSCGQARFSLQLLPVEEYPALPEMPVASGELAAEDFAKAVNQVVVAAGRDELLPVFTGVRMEIDGSQLSLLATDRYRMALKELDWTPASNEASGAALVPARVLAEAARSMAGGESITMALATSGLGDGLIGLAGSGGGVSRQLTTRLLSGEFPKVRHLMDIAPAVSVHCRTDELVASVKRVSLVAERNTPLRMVISSDEIALEAASGDQAQASEKIEAIVENVAGGEPSIEAAGFNPHYLADALAAIDAPFVRFCFTEAAKPCLVQGINEIDGEPISEYRHVIMLMRLPS